MDRQCCSPVSECFPSYLRLSVAPLLIIWRCPLKAIYLFMRLCDGSSGNCASPRARIEKWKERMAVLRQRCRGALARRVRKNKNSVFFIKEYFYCYFVVKRRECISLDCMSWELSGRLYHLIHRVTKRLVGGIFFLCFLRRSFPLQHNMWRKFPRPPCRCQH